MLLCFFFSSRRRHTRWPRDWSSDVCSSDLGESQPPGHASIECFDDRSEWAWVRGRFDRLTRMIAAGPAYVVDVLVFSGEDERLLELPWHIAGRGVVETPGRWVDDELPDEFVTRVQRFVPDQP